MSGYEVFELGFQDHTIRALRAALSLSLDALEATPAAEMAVTLGGAIAEHRDTILTNTRDALNRLDAAMATDPDADGMWVVTMTPLDLPCFAGACDAGLAGLDALGVDEHGDLRRSYLHGLAQIFARFGAISAIYDQFQDRRMTRWSN